VYGVPFLDVFTVLAFMEIATRFSAGKEIAPLTAVALNAIYPLSAFKGISLLALVPRGRFL
jgi:hypothetical protein